MKSPSHTVMEKVGSYEKYVNYPVMEKAGSYEKSVNYPVMGKVGAYEVRHLPCDGESRRL